MQIAAFDLGRDAEADRRLVVAGGFVRFGLSWVLRLVIRSSLDVPAVLPVDRMHASFAQHIKRKTGSFHCVVRPPAITLRSSVAAFGRLFAPCRLAAWFPKDRDRPLGQNGSDCPRYCCQIICSPG